MKTKPSLKECLECKETFRTTLDFMDHMNFHTGFKPYMCGGCGVKFCQRTEYLDHALLYPNFHFYPCSACDVIFHTPDLLNHHISLCSANISALDDASERAEFLNTQALFPLKRDAIKTVISIRTKDPDNKTISDKSDNARTVERESNGESTVNQESSVQRKNHRYTCCLCPEVYANKTSLKLHRRSHFNLLKFGCRTCKKKFRNSKQLIKHLKCHTVKNKKCVTSLQNSEKKFPCPYCNKAYTTEERLSKHECFVSSGGEPFFCSCFKEFDEITTFKKHIGERPYKCCRCDMQFNTITNLIRHIRTHTKQKPFVCKYCGRGFSQSANLKNHETVHSGPNAVRCDKCDFSCKTQNGLMKHKKKHEEGYVSNSSYFDARRTSRGNSQCPICGKEFPFKRNLGMHMKVHKRKECLCPECGKIFETQGRLSMHYKACHGQPSMCTVCGKNFASMILLSAHEKIHVVEKQFSCNICFKMFSIKSYLVQHMKTHNSGKHYSCARCGKLFKVAASLKYHSRICL